MLRKRDYLNEAKNEEKATFWEKTFRKSIEDWSKSLRLSYLVVKVTFLLKGKDAKPETIQISGNIVIMTSWLANLASRADITDYKLMAVTRDRNMSRKLATEI